jgi:hypothetical protein
MMVAAQRSYAGERLDVRDLAFQAPRSLDLDRERAS